MLPRAPEARVALAAGTESARQKNEPSGLDRKGRNIKHAALRQEIERRGLTRKLTWRCRGGALAGEENSTKIRGGRTRRGGVQVERKVRLNARKGTDEPNPAKNPSGAPWASRAQEDRTDEADEEREERDQSKKMNDSTTGHTWAKRPKRPGEENRVGPGARTSSAGFD